MRWFTLDRASPLPLIRQIYAEISDQILSGDLAAREKLPSTREASEELGVSRNVVLAAYDQLVAEGYVLSIEGAGTFVAEGSCLGERRSTRPVGSGRPSAIAAREPPSIEFVSGRPALDLVPYRSWARSEYAARLAAPFDSLGYAPSEGRIELREAVSRYLMRKRGIECGGERIIITSGALQAVSLLARLVLKPGSVVLAEDPGTRQAADVFRLEGAEVVPVPVDADGLRTDLLPSDRSPSLIFVTPSHQFPLGGSLSIQRRIELITYARAASSLIVEDDYESEFRYDGQPVSSLQRLDPERVAYVGTFSKIFFPALRLGYLVAPEAIVERCRELKRASDRFSPPAAQLAMARFMDEGRLDRHIARMKREYRKRRDALVGALESAFPGRVRVLGQTTGLHLVAAFEDVEFDAARLDALRSAGVGLFPVEDCAILKGHHTREVVMGYSHLSPAEIEAGVAIMKKAL